MFVGDTATGPVSAGPVSGGTATIYRWQVRDCLPGSAGMGMHPFRLCPAHTQIYGTCPKTKLARENRTQNCFSRCNVNANLTKLPLAIRTRVLKPNHIVENTTMILFQLHPPCLCIMRSVWWLAGTAGTARTRDSHRDRRDCPGRPGTSGSPGSAGTVGIGWDTQSAVC